MGRYLPTERAMRHSNRGRASKAGVDLKYAVAQIESGSTVLSVPEGRLQEWFRISIKRFFARRGKEVIASSIGDSEIYVRIREE